MFTRILKRNRRVNGFWLMLSCLALMSLNGVRGYAADGCSAVNFRGPRPYVIGQYPYHLRAGDFNGDGKADIAAADYYGNSVRVAFGDGAGGFASAINVLTGAKAVFVTSGDLNNDGKPDLLVSNFDANTISVLLNNGASGFTVTNYSAGIGPEGIALGDFNGDSKPDVLVANPDESTLALLYNNGAGGLSAPGIIALAPGSKPHEVIAADFNNDGRTDLASVNQNSTVSVLLGLNNGGLSNATEVNVPPMQDLKAIVAGDVTGDGKLDLITASYTQGRVQVLAGNGNGGFSPTVSFTTSTTQTDLELGDINADGKQDILVIGSSNYSNPLVTVLYGNGTSTVSSAQDIAMVGPTARSIALADLNSDGKPDLVANYATPFNAGLTLSFNNGAGKIETAELLTGPPVLPASSPYVSPVITDFNLDGKADLAVGFFAGVAVRLGLSNGDLGSRVDYPISQQPGQLLAGDFNGDGRPDIAATVGSNVSVLLNNGSGGFGAPVNTSIGGGPTALVTGDFNRDGKLDFVVAFRGLHLIRFFSGNGNGTFTLATTVNINAHPTAMAAGDFNDDGKLDVLTFNACDGVGCFAKQLTIFAGDGMGGFALPVDATTIASSVGVGLQNFATADFNSDGRLDLIYVRDGDPTASPQIALNTGNTGNARFAAPSYITAATGVRAFAVGDINSDGKPDLVTVRDNYTTDIQFFLNRGGINFDPPVTYTATSNLNAVTIGDINSDGKRDVVFTGLYGAWRLLNKCALRRGGQTTDFDGDGITDLSVFRPSNGTWYIIQSSDNAFRVVPFGTNGDLPVPGDYDGDGKTDVAIWRPANGTWYYLRSSDGQFAFQQFGASGDIPVPGDYDGDGRANFAVWRQSTGTWYTSLDPAINYGAVVWGFPTDVPTPADYD